MQDCSKRIRYFEWGTSRSPARLSRPTFSKFLDAVPKLIGIRSPGPHPRLICTKKPIYFNESAVGFVRWDSLKDVLNKSMAKSILAIAPEADSWKLKRKAVLQLAQKAKSFDLRYILAILNSSLAPHLLASQRRSNLHIYPDDYKNIPIPKVPKPTQNRIIKRVERIERLAQLEYDFPKAAIAITCRHPRSAVPIRHYQTDDLRAPIRAIPECDVMLAGIIRRLLLRREKQKTVIVAAIETPDGNESVLPIVSLRSTDEALAEFCYILLDSFLAEWRPSKAGGRKLQPVYETVAQLLALIAYEKGTELFSPSENADRIRQVMTEIRHELGRNDLSKIRAEIAVLDREIDEIVFDLYDIPLEERARIRAELGARAAR